MSKMVGDQHLLLSLHHSNIVNVSEVCVCGYSLGLGLGLGFAVGDCLACWACA